MIECCSLCYKIATKGDPKLKWSTEQKRFVLNLCRPTAICACGQECQPSVIHRKEHPERMFLEVSSFDKHDKNNKPSENVGTETKDNGFKLNEKINGYTVVFIVPLTFLSLSLNPSFCLQILFGYRVTRSERRLHCASHLHQPLVVPGDYFDAAHAWKTPKIRIWKVSPICSRPGQNPPLAYKPADQR